MNSSSQAFLHGTVFQPQDASISGKKRRKLLELTTRITQCANAKQRAGLEKKLLMKINKLAGNFPKVGRA